jgi:hypothetical protein
MSGDPNAVASRLLSEGLKKIIYPVNPALFKSRRVTTGNPSPRVRTSPGNGTLPMSSQNATRPEVFSA